jgi:hypothetical protein|tara:strand:- start:15701 stop:15979 length:279 start_codon:yes stop_codon:yes gene_type:complete
MTDPFTILEKKDSDHKFLCLCSYVSICENKKMNLANVLLLSLKEDKYKWIFINILEVENEFELVKMFLQYDPFLYKSKYITKFFKTYDKYRK